MSNPPPTGRMAEPLGSDALTELALDLRWSYNHAADHLWQQLDPELWALSHNPWFVLQTLSRSRLAAVADSPQLRQIVADLLSAKQQALETPSWFHQAFSEAPFSAVAYFSMEFMLSEALPIYSGGLGNVAGDQLKTASDLGVPVVGVGLLFQQGYFRQEIDSRGRQQAMYPFNDPSQLPIRPLRDASGEWVRFSIALPWYVLWVRAWQVQIGRVRLILLDTNDLANTPVDRGITSELYGGNADLRLKQEIVLGIGGYRVLRLIGLNPDVCHLNEGHAAFAVLERARHHMAEHHESFELALTTTRTGNLFTTHTPVEAGFDRFSPDLMSAFLRTYAQQELCVAFDDLLALGRRDRHDHTEPFNMAYLAVRGSGAVNGVSRLHGAVSRRIFQPLFVRWPEVEIPIGHVTNGVHMPTWDSAQADGLWETLCGKARWQGTLQEVETNLRGASDADLWRLRCDERRSLVEFVHERLARQLAERGAPAEDIARAATTFDPGALTLGFARRFATYKRPNLLLHNPDRLARILADERRPMQLVIAGKAHPEDGFGQDLITQWIAFVRRPDVRGRVVFLSDYDMLVADRLVQGVDLWINTPRRPWEACGTSGMKVLVNGGLNVSELDGWWAEAYAPDVGWALGDGRDRGEDSAWDSTEADTLYALLEGDVAAAFYTRNDRALPTGWIARMRESMARLTPAFSSNRSVRDYTTRYYVPAARAHRERTANNRRRGVEVFAWASALERGWGTATFQSMDVHADGDRHVFQVRLNLGDVNPDHVRVELYADGQGGGAPTCQAMTRTGAEARNGPEHLHVASVAASRPASDFTPRLVPFHADAAVPLEAPFILWYR